MNMADDQADGHLVYKDAIFISPHKFIGGPGTPGILIARNICSIIASHRIQGAAPWITSAKTTTFSRQTLLSEKKPVRPTFLVPFVQGSPFSSKRPLV